MKITIFGLAGSGTSTVGKLLAENLGYEFMSTGNIFRKYAEDAGMNLYEFENKVANKDLNFDIKLDNEVAEYGKNTENFIFESRLAWHFIPDSFKIFLDCHTEERYRRIHQREGGNIEEITQNNTLREHELEIRYANVYPNITFPPSSKDFDITINAASLTAQEIVEHIIEQLK